MSAFALTIAPCLVGAQNSDTTQTSSRSAVIDDIRYDVTFTRANAAARQVRVAMTFQVTGTDPVLLSLPDWTPGAYEISNFSRWVTGFGATSAGQPLDWDKLGPSTWRVRPTGAGAVTVQFDYVADTLDNAMSWARPDFLLFNGTNVFMYPEGQSLNFPATVSVTTEPGWLVATGMPVAGTGSMPRTYAASDYHDLVDRPFFVGRFDVDSAEISGTWVRLATYPSGSLAGAQRATTWDQLKRVIPPEVAVFGEAPWSTYTVMQIADSSYLGASGLEHQNSHVDVITPIAIGNAFMPSLYAHEIFHAWNVKRLRPSDMWPYKYDSPQPTPWLWVSEGITDYYADLAEVRGGVVDAEGFYALTTAKMSEVMNTPAVALEDASVNTWIQPVDGTGYIYYAKGALAGLLIDIMIRDASDNTKSLDSVMRELYATTYKQGRGFTSQDWWGAVSRAAGGKSFAEFNARYIDGRERFPWDSILPLAGLRMIQERAPRLGVFSAPDENGVKVTTLEPESAAAAAGVREGDYLLSVGDIDVQDLRFGELFRAKFGNAPEGAPLSIQVRRGAQTLTLSGKLRFAPGEPRLVAVANAPEKALKIRQGILGK